MKRSFEAVDIMVAVGFCATILGGVLFVTASNGMGGFVAGEAASSTQPLFQVNILQPALGEAIVSHTLLDQGAQQETAAAADQLNRATMRYHMMQGTPNGYLAPTLAWAATVEANNMARAEWVKGRSIVNFTIRGARHGWLSADQYMNGYNDRMIERADAAGTRVVDDFATTWQENMGQAIVQASHDHQLRSDRIQEGIGAAVVRVTAAQIGYEESSGAIQAQYAALTNAALRSEMQGDLFSRLAQGEAGAAPMQAASASRPWPEISSVHLLGASLVLMGLLFAGFFLATRRPVEAEIRPYTTLEPLEERTYRKTA